MNINRFRELVANELSKSFYSRMDRSGAYNRASAAVIANEGKSEATMKAKQDARWKADDASRTAFNSGESAWRTGDANDHHAAADAHNKAIEAHKEAAKVHGQDKDDQGKAFHLGKVAEHKAVADLHRGNCEPEKK
jgi:hypothetical protein